MSADEMTSRSFSLRRWSERKRAAARNTPETIPESGAVPAPLPQPSAAAAGSAAEPVPAPVALPPIESLTIESDFTAFLQPKVAESVKRQALKQLFRDPRFNVMDGLDVYIDDYSQPDPISPEVVKGLMQARYIFDPPQTRVNEHGAIEDVPAADAAALPDESQPAGHADAAPAVCAGTPANVGACTAPADAAVSPPSDMSARDAPADSAVLLPTDAAASPTSDATDNPPTDAAEAPRPVLPDPAPR